MTDPHAEREAAWQECCEEHLRGVSMAAPFRECFLFAWERARADCERKVTELERDLHQTDLLALRTENARLVGLLAASERHAQRHFDLREKAEARVREIAKMLAGERGRHDETLSALAAERERSAKVRERLTAMCADWDGAAKVHENTSQQDHSRANRGTYEAKAATYQRCAELLREALSATPHPIPRYEGYCDMSKPDAAPAAEGRMSRPERTLDGFFSIEYSDCHSQATYDNAREAWPLLQQDRDRLRAELQRKSERVIELEKAVTHSGDVAHGLRAELEAERRSSSDWIAKCITARESQRETATALAQSRRELESIKAGRDAQKHAADAHYDELQDTRRKWEQAVEHNVRLSTAMAKQEERIAALSSALQDGRMLVDSLLTHSKVSDWDKAEEWLKRTGAK